MKVLWLKKEWKDIVFDFSAENLRLFVWYQLQIILDLIPDPLINC